MISILAAKCLIVIYTQKGSYRNPMYLEARALNTEREMWQMDFTESMKKVLDAKTFEENSPYVRYVNNNDCLVTERKDD